MKPDRVTISSNFATYMLTGYDYDNMFPLIYEEKILVEIQKSTYE